MFARIRVLCARARSNCEAENLLDCRRFLRLIFFSHCRDLSVCRGCWCRCCRGMKTKAKAVTWNCRDSSGRRTRNSPQPESCRTDTHDSNHSVPLSVESLFIHPKICLQVHTHLNCARSRSLSSRSLCTAGRKKLVRYRLSYQKTREFVDPCIRKQHLEKKLNEEKVLRLLEQLQYARHKGPRLFSCTQRALLHFHDKSLWSHP